MNLHTAQKYHSIRSLEGKSFVPIKLYSNIRLRNQIFTQIRFLKPIYIDETRRVPALNIISYQFYIVLVIQYYLFYCASQS